NRPRAFDRSEDGRAARRADLGRVQPGPRLDLLLYAAGPGRERRGGVMSKRVLVIEDQEDNRRIVRDLLASVGYETIEAETGETAAVPGTGRELRCAPAYSRRQAFPVGDGSLSCVPRRGSWSWTIIR